MVSEATDQTGGVGLPVGAKIGKYEVVERIGVGGQSIVYRCHDALLDRYVAIKQISPHLAEDPTFLERFREEAKILAKLGAEIITIHELIEEPEGLFIVMEFVEGHTLETIFTDTDGPTEMRAALQVLWRLAATLHEVHSAGIVHRDLKPSNIIVAEGLRPKIADFGVAASGTEQASMRLGTTKYMAPELFEGGPVDGRADMYSLGFIAYEMLAGRPKFNEIFADLMRDPRSEALRWMKWHGNPHVEAPPLHEVNSQIPEALSEIVARMMAKDVDERFESMEALGREIKTRFSPRARQAASAQVPVAVGAGEGAAAAGAEAVLDEMGPGSGDEAEELEIGPEGPATAPLPKRKLSLRTRLILVGIIVVSCAAIGVVYGWQKRTEKLAVARRARDSYDKAEEHYNQGRHAEALKGFQAVQDQYRGTPHAAKAHVLERMSKAHLALSAAEWEEAARQYRQALDDLKRVQARSSSLREWAKSWRSKLQGFEETQTDTQAFVTQMALAREHFEAEEFEKARNVLLSNVAPYIGEMPAREASFQEFLETINRTEFTQGYDRLLERGDERVKAGKYTEAAEEYARAQDLIQGITDSPDRLSAKGALSKGEGDRLLGQLQARLDGLKKRQQYEELIRAAAAAGTTAEKVRAYEQAAQLNPAMAADLKDKINTLKAAAALAKALQFKAQGNSWSAQQAANESLKYKKTKEAQDLLDDLKRGVQRQGLVRQALRELRGRKYDKALEMFQASLKIRTTVRQREDVRTHITECRYQIQLAKADELRKQKKYDEAAVAYEQAARIKRAARAEIDARLTAMRQRQKYEQLIAEGQAALAAQKWKAALDAFRQAKATMDTEEVARLIARTRYSENLARGQAAMDQKEYNSAVGYFNLAKGFMDTKEINDLINEVKILSGAPK